MTPANTAVLLLTRDVAEIQRSFGRVRWRENVDPHLLERCVVHHIDRARQAVEQFGIPCLEVDYSDFANTPEVTATRVGDFFGIELNAGDLGYIPGRNSSSAGGRARRVLESLRSAVPTPIKKSARRLLRR
ncbi:MAG: hypothetical protein ACKVIN_06705 [Longimicrobiales bacterium]